MTGNLKIVVKVGSNILAQKDVGIDTKQLEEIVNAVAELYEGQNQPVIVSSGAIACGLEILGYASKPKDITILQAAASVGQGKLVEHYTGAFDRRKIKVGQVLLTRSDFLSRQSYIYAKRTLERLLLMGVVPVVNENDATAVEEIKFGDNDTLAALVAAFIGADRLFLLSDVDGLYRDYKKPETIIHRVDEITEEIESCAKAKTGKYGSGGMRAKIQSARIASCAGVTVQIINGSRPEMMIPALRGEKIGTTFTPGKRVKGKKHWIAFVLLPKGKIFIDEGAVKALIERKKSLLPAGIVDVKGNFEAGDAVLVVNEKGKQIAKGITDYSSDEVKKAMGKTTTKLKKYGMEELPDEVVHRDKLVILKDIRKE